MAKKEVTKVRIMKPLWGKFKMPYNVGQFAKIESKLAGELIAGGYAISEADAKKLDKVEETEDSSKSKSAEGSGDNKSNPGSTEPEKGTEGSNDSDASKEAPEADKKK